MPLSDADLDSIEAECRKDPTCPWSAVKLAMVEEIRALRDLVQRRIPALDERVTSLEGRFNFRAHLARQAAWSERTFGPGTRTDGILDHIQKEMKEVRSASVDYSRTMQGDNPEALKEWIDIVILGLDGAWRSGATPDQIIEALAAKQAKNEARTWPDWRTADPSKAIEHDRSADAKRSPNCGLDLKLVRGDGRTAEACRDRFTGFPGAPDGFVVEHPAEAAGDAPTS